MVPPEVQQFIQEHILSAEQLDILLQLYFNAEQEWDPEAVSKAVFTTPTSAQAKLDGLVEAGFLSKIDGSPPRYRYAPADLRLNEGVTHLGAAYRDNRGDVLECVFAKNRNPVQHFANAFRLGRRDS